MDPQDSQNQRSMDRYEGSIINYYLFICFLPDSCDYQVDKANIGLRIFRYQSDACRPVRMTVCRR